MALGNTGTGADISAGLVLVSVFVWYGTGIDSNCNSS